MGSPRGLLPEDGAPGGEDGIVFAAPGHGGHRDSPGVALQLHVLPSTHNNRPDEEHE